MLHEAARWGHLSTYFGLSLNQNPHLPNLVPFTQSPENYQLKMALCDREQTMVRIVRRIRIIIYHFSQFSQ
jgi:hypothetical protein